MRKNVKNKGFTLFEMLLYVSLMGSILVAVVLFIISVTDSRVETDTVNQVELEGSKIAEIIENKILNAKNINSPSANNNGVSLSLESYEPLDDPIEFAFIGTELNLDEGNDGVLPLNSTSTEVYDGYFERVEDASFNIIKFGFSMRLATSSDSNLYSYSKNWTGAVSLRKP